jgi:predicted nucleotidyltransferase
MEVPMRTLPFAIDEKRIAAFCLKHGVKELALFGSVLRDDFDSESDVDVLVTMHEGSIGTIERFLDMQDELSAMFRGRKIDLVQKQLLTNPYRRHEILRTQEILYAA